MRDLAQLASRLFLPVGVRVGKCLNRENEGDEGEGDGQRSHQVSPVCESAPHSHYRTHSNGSFGRPKVSSVSDTALEIFGVRCFNMSPLDSITGRRRSKYVLRAGSKRDNSSVASADPF
jgi:hypothetical protein